MLGPKLSSVFASRWKALWWSATVILSAYFLVPHEDQVSDPSVAALADVSKAIQQVNRNTDEPPAD
jgi:hypothetical protein